MSVETRSITLKSVVVLLGLLVALTVVVAGAIVGANYGMGLHVEQTLTVVAWAIVVHGALVHLATHLRVRRRGLTWGALGFVRPTKRIWHLL